MPDDLAAVLRTGDIEPDVPDVLDLFGAERFVGLAAVFQAADDDGDIHPDQLTHRLGPDTAVAAVAAGDDPHLVIHLRHRNSLPSCAGREPGRERLPSPAPAPPYGFRVTDQVLLDGQWQDHLLVVPGGLVDFDVRQSHVHQDGADVLLLELDRALRSVAQERLQRSVVVRLAIGLPGKLGPEHREVDGDNQLNLLA
jgi:hypothetical protein